MPVTVQFYIHKHRRIDDTNLPDGDVVKCENQFSRLPKHINSYLENIRSLFTNSFIKELLAKIENARIFDINDVILSIVKLMQTAATPKVRKVKLTTQPWFGLMRNVRR